MIQPPLPYSLRAMTLGDVPAVLAIENASYPTPRRSSFFEHELTDSPFAAYQVLVRHDAPGAETVLGHAGYWLLTDHAHVVTITVRPEDRGRGLGELLLLNLLSLVCQAAASRVTLEVRAGNLPAQNLYSKCRFVVMGRRRNYYHDTHEDALVMQVDLAASPGYCTWVGEQASQLFGRLAHADFPA